MNPHARAGRGVGGQRGGWPEPSSSRGCEVPRRPGADIGRRQVHVRPAVREVAGQVRLHRRRQGGAGRQVPGSSSSPRSRSPGSSPHSAASGASSSARPGSRSTAISTRRPRHRALHARRLEGRAADGPKAATRLFSEGPAVRRRAPPRIIPEQANIWPPSAPARSGAPSSRTTRLRPPEGREEPDRLPLLRLGYNYRGRQRQPPAPEGCSGAPGHPARRGRSQGLAWPPRASPACRPGHRPDEGVADTRGAVDKVLPGRPTRRRNLWPRRAGQRVQGEGRRHATFPTMVSGPRWSPPGSSGSASPRRSRT